MASGWLFKGVCYGDFGSAASTFCQEFGGPTGNGNFTCSKTYPNAGDNVPVIDVSLNGSLVAGEVGFPPLPVCDMPLDWSDGLMVGWAVATAWVAVAVIKFLRRGSES